MESSTRNIYEAVFGETRNSHDGSSIAAIDLGKDGARVAYNELQAQVDGVRAATDIKPGETLALVMPNSLELIVGLLASWAEGAATAPLNPAYTSVEFRELFSDLGVKTILILPGEEKLKGVLQEASKDLRIIEIDLIQAQSSPNQRVREANTDDGTALYLHTSGTTGKPKAVPLKHTNLLRGAKNVAETYSLDSNDRTYLLQVLFHIHGIVAAFLAPLTTGGSIVIPPGGKLDASRAWTDFSDHKCNWVTGTPSILQTLLAAPCPEPLPAIRFMRSCSSPLLPTVFEALRKRFNCPVIEAYAMTEASHQMCSNRLDLFTSGTVGPESGAAKICIWNGGNRASDLGVEGEVSVTGDNVMDGYEGVSPEKNTEAFWHGSDERGNEARWFRTGDRGVLSTDGHRRLTLIGRLSEMVNRGGEKISPVEVDEAIMLASDSVKEAASFSVLDDFYGQEIEAAVVLTPGSELNEKKLQDLLEKRLAKFKVPKRIHFCEGTIPKGPTGKIQRKNLTQKFGDSSSRGAAKGAVNDGNIFDIMDNALNLPSGKSKKHQEATLLELGADSLGLAKIVSGAKRQLGRQLDMATMFSFPTVEEVVKMANTGSTGEKSEGRAETKPEAFSLLPIGKDCLESLCSQAGVPAGNVEDAFPLSSSQKMYFSTFLGNGKDTDLMWQMNRYQMSSNIDLQRLLQALQTLQKHEESLRWTLVEDPKLGWITMQLQPGIEDRVHVHRCNTEEEATQIANSRLESCKHFSGVRTAVILVIEIGDQLEMTFIESHGFTEGQGRAQMLDVLAQAYNDEPLDEYMSYSSFVQHFPMDQDKPRDLDFWKKEKASADYCDGADSALKRKALENPIEYANDRLEAVASEQAVQAPFNKLSTQTSMTLPFIVEAAYALALALYFGQQDDVFLRGTIVYDRCISLRTSEPQFSSVRAVTGGYHPNFMLLDLAQSSLWAYFQYFKAMTQMREGRTCISNTANIANHSAAFTWRFADDGEVEHEDAESGARQLVAGVKDEKAAIQAFKMCYVNANRKGADGVTIAVGFHQKWLQDQRDRGCKIELMDIFCGALKFCADNHASLQELSLEDLQKAVLP